MTFLPSEKARLVLGYLLEQDLPLTSRQLLSECGLLEEVAYLPRDRLGQVTRVQGTSLHQILDNYQASGLQPQTEERQKHQSGACTRHKVMGQSSAADSGLLGRQVAPLQQMVQVKQLELGVHFNLSLPTPQHHSTSSGTVLGSLGQPQPSSTQGHSIPALQRVDSLKKRTCQDHHVLSPRTTTTNKTTHQKIPVQLHQGLDGKLRVSSTQYPPIKVGPGVGAPGENLGARLIGEGPGPRVVGEGHRPVAISFPRPSPKPTKSACHIQPNSRMEKQMTPEEAKMKCKLFLEKLLKPVSDSREAGVGRNVQGLVEGLLGGKLEPQTFITRLQEQLKGKLPASHQLGLVYFLRKWLPSLQDSLAKGELAVEGVTVPEHQEKGGVEENTDINLLKNIPSLLDGSDSHTVRPRTRPGVKKLAALGLSDSDEDDDMEGWVQPSKKLKIDENINCGADAEALDTHLQAAGSERPNVRLIQLAEKLQGLAPEHEKEVEQEMFLNEAMLIKKAVFIKEEVFSKEEICEEEFRKEVSRNEEVIQEEVAHEPVMKEEVIQEEMMVYKEDLCKEASQSLAPSQSMLPQSPQCPSLHYLAQFPRPRSTVYSSLLPPRAGASYNDTVSQEKQEVIPEEQEFSCRDQEVTSDEVEEVTSQEVKEVTSQLLKEMRTYQDRQQEATPGKTGSWRTVRRTGSWDSWDEGVRASLGPAERSTGHLDYRSSMVVRELSGRWKPRDGFELDELVEGLELEAVELSPEAQRIIEVFANKLLERIEEYVAEEVVKVDQVEARVKNCICCKLEAVLETSPDRPGSSGVPAEAVGQDIQGDTAEMIGRTEEEVVMKEHQVK